MEGCVLKKMDLLATGHWRIVRSLDSGRTMTRVSRSNGTQAKQPP